MGDYSEYMDDKQPKVSRKYTVLLWYQVEATPSFLEFKITAKSSKQAAFFAKYQASKDTDLDAHEFEVVGIFEGWLENLYE